ERWRLLPIVMNVSEVAASLAQPKEDDKTSALTIDPKRLLIALLRSFMHQRQRSEIFDKPEYADLAQQIEEGYRRAAAAEFKRSTELASEAARAQSREIEIEAKADDALKFLPVLTGFATVGFALLGWGTAQFTYRILAAAAALVTVALSIRWKRSV